MQGAYDSLHPMLPPHIACCSVLQCVAVCCSALQCVAVRCSVLQCVAVSCSVLQYVAVCCCVPPHVATPYRLVDRTYMYDLVRATR